MKFSVDVSVSLSEYQRQRGMFFSERGWNPSFIGGISNSGLALLQTVLTRGRRQSIPSNLNNTSANILSANSRPIPFHGIFIRSSIERIKYRQEAQRCLEAFFIVMQLELTYLRSRCHYTMELDYWNIDRFLENSDILNMILIISIKIFQRNIYMYIIVI